MIQQQGLDFCNGCHIRQDPWCTQQDPQRIHTHAPPPQHLQGQKTQVSQVLVGFGRWLSIDQWHQETQTIVPSQPVSVLHVTFEKVIHPLSLIHSLILSESVCWVPTSYWEMWRHRGYCDDHKTLGFFSYGAYKSSWLVRGQYPHLFNELCGLNDLPKPSLFTNFLKLKVGIKNYKLFQKVFNQFS